MATLRQKKAFDKMVENGGNASKAMRESGYGTTSVNPQKLTKSKGFKQLMDESGLTEELIATSLVKDIKKKPKNRVSELRLGAEILGMNKREEGGNNKTLIVVVAGETSQRYAIPSIAENSSPGSSQI